MNSLKELKADLESSLRMERYNEIHIGTILKYLDKAHELGMKDASVVISQIDKADVANYKEVQRDLNKVGTVWL